MLTETSGNSELVDLMQIYYGPSTDRRYYSGNAPGISNTYDDENEITAAYVSFSTAYLPFDTAPSLGLMFEIEVGSRFDRAETKVMRPNFAFSYPGNVDTTIPIIDMIRGDGCDEIGARALNCPTDGKHEDQPARIVLYGRQFPDTENATVTVTIDGVECKNVLYGIEEDRQGLRNVSCEFGAGVSGHGEKGYSSVVLQYIAAGQSQLKTSDAKPYFSYSPPIITNITGCLEQVDHMHTSNCTRTGGEVRGLRITGKNFGASDARVFIGGSEAVSNEHAVNDRKLQCFPLSQAIVIPGTRFLVFFV